MRKIVFVLFVLAATIAAAAPLRAHHSSITIYDPQKPITLTGTVTQMDYINPHIIWYLDVEDASGNVTNWSVEGGSPASLHRNGWTRDALKPGDQVTVEGFRTRREGTTHINGRNVTFPDGRRVFGGTADDGLPNER